MLDLLSGQAFNDLLRKELKRRERQSYVQVAGLSAPQSLLIAGGDEAGMGALNPEACLKSLLDPKQREGLRPCYWGADQHWYPDEWQRRAGCGPSTTANLCLYPATHHPQFRDLAKGLAAPVKAEEMTELMLRTWQYVTPGRHGVNRATMLSDGFKAYALNCDCPCETAIMEVPEKQDERPTEGELFRFIRESLDEDMPLALLVLSKGRVKRLETWHWTTVLGLWQEEARNEDKRGGSWSVLTADNGALKLIDLPLWLRSSRLGGAVFRVLKP